MTSVSAAHSPRRAQPATQRLENGASGAAVRELQQLLKAAGLYGKNVDGRFGPVTQAVVLDLP